MQKAHPELDWGIHLTLTAEWKNYKWGGVSSSDKISSLLDKNGYFYSSVEEFSKHAKSEEVETAVPAKKWNEFYNEVIQNLKRGLNEIIFHLAFNDNEMKAVTIDRADFGAEWRQNDFNYVMSEEFKNLLTKDDIHLITWGDIQKTLKNQLIN